MHESEKFLSCKVRLYVILYLLMQTKCLSVVTVQIGPLTALLVLVLVITSKFKVLLVYQINTKSIQSLKVAVQKDLELIKWVQCIYT